MTTTDSQNIQFKLPTDRDFAANQILEGIVRVDVTMPSGNVRTVDTPLKNWADIKYKDIIDWKSDCPISIQFNKDHCNTILSILKKHKCNHCEKSFTQSRNRRRHIKVNHK
jgi:hypothetical protein